MTFKPSKKNAPRAVPCLKNQNAVEKQNAFHISFNLTEFPSWVSEMKISTYPAPQSVNFVAFLVQSSSAALYLFLQWKFESFGKMKLWVSQ